MIFSYLVVFTSTVSSYLKFVASIPMSAFTGLLAGEYEARYRLCCAGCWHSSKTLFAKSGCSGRQSPSQV